LNAHNRLTRGTATAEDARLGYGDTRPLMLRELPAVITHNYHPERGAFHNVCCPPPGDAERVISSIRRQGFSHLKQDYLERRMRVEAWLIAERTRKLGDTPLGRPIYCFLGNMADGWDKSRPASIVLRLADFDASMLTFTFPDSMTSCPQPRGPNYRAKPHHEQVFTLEEIRDVASRYGFPNPELPRERRGTEDAFIEVQIWDDRPLERYRP
jgi:hypothetical protein